MPWICDGQPKDGKSYPNAAPHTPFENYGPDCSQCGLPQAAMQKGGKAKRPRPQGTKTQMSRSPQKTIALAGALTVLLVGSIGGGFWWWRSRSTPEPEPTPTISPSTPTPAPTSTTSSTSPSPSSPSPSPNPITSPSPPPANIPLAERISSGDRVLFTYRGNFDRDGGVAAFAQGDYDQAIPLFEKAVDSAPNDPEPQIYLNNALARQAGNPLVIAAVVPVDNRATSAEEILRGVADAQAQFNRRGGFNNRLLEVILVNDSNDPTVATEVAQQLANNPDVMGVIGHNSSEASAAALAVYEQQDLAVVSPTSTSITLNSPVFFRTVPSDQASGNLLAEYVANDLNVDQVLVFYDAQSNYSQSLLQTYDDRFSQLGGQVIRMVDISSAGFTPGTELRQLIADTRATVAILLPSTNTTSVAISIARSNAQLPVNQQLTLVGGDALYIPAMLTEGRDAVEEMVLVVPWFAPTNAYARRAEIRWNGRINWRTANGFDATQALITAVLKANNRQEVIENLYDVSLPAQETSGEILQFTSTGDRQGIPILIEVVPGGVGPVGSSHGFERLK